MKRNRFLISLAIAFSMASCGVEDKIEEAEQALADLEEYEKQLGEEGVEQSDVELALSEMMDEELADADGTAINMSDDDFSALGDQSSSEVSEAVTTEQEQDDPTIKMRRAAFLNMIVEGVFEVADSDTDGFVDLDEFKTADFIGAGAQLASFREILFKAANQHCKDKDEDTETLNADEVRCLVRRVIAHKVKKHYQAFAKEERKSKRDEKRLKGMKEFQKREIGVEGKELTEEQKEQMKAKVAEKKAKFDKKRTEITKVKEERTTNPDEYKKRLEEKRAARAAKKAAALKP